MRGDMEYGKTDFGAVSGCSISPYGGCGSHGDLGVYEF